MNVPSRENRAKRIVATVVAVLFCFQMARFYITISLELVQCYEPLHTHSAGVPHSHDDHHHGEDAAPHSHDAGFFFQHCKDTYEGAALVPMQPFGVPVEVVHLLPATPQVTVSQPEPILLEQAVPPPFQPPRA